jgi:hypothetical protein
LHQSLEEFTSVLEKNFILIQRDIQEETKNQINVHKKSSSVSKERLKKLKQTLRNESLQFLIFLKFHLLF